MGQSTTDSGAGAGSSQGQGIMGLVGALAGSGTKSNPPAEGTLAGQPGAKGTLPQQQPQSNANAALWQSLVEGQTKGGQNGAGATGQQLPAATSSQTPDASTSGLQSGSLAEGAAGADTAAGAGEAAAGLEGLDEYGNLLDMIA